MGSHKSGSSRDAIKAAEQLGYFTVLLTNNSKQLTQRTEYPDVHLMWYCELDDLEKIRETIKKLQRRFLEIYAIVSFIDPWCGQASQLAKEHGIYHFSTEAIYIMQNKLQSREILKGTEYIPKFLSLTTNTTSTISSIENMFPVVVKHTDSSGSKDVYYCDNDTAFYKNVKKLMDKYLGGTILVEEYLDGPQYLIETLVIDKRVYIVAIVEQEITHYNGHFIVTGYSLCLDYTDEFYHKLKKAVEMIINKHQFESGPCHLEMRLVKDCWNLIEINPRISGAGMNHFLEIGLGINLVNETLKLALKEEVNLEHKIKQYTFSEYIVVDQPGKLVKVTGKNQALNSPGVKFVYVKPRKLSRLIPPISLGNRYAYVIATGKSKEEAKQNAKEAASIIQFHLTD